LTAAGVVAAATVAQTREQTAAATAAVVGGLTAATIAMEQTAATTATAATAVAAQPGNGRALLTAHQGDADHREEHRDAKHKCTIHPKFLQTVNRYVPQIDNPVPSSIPPNGPHATAAHGNELAASFSPA
jgi:hypothetical protein